MATILIYGHDLQMARRLCDPLRREKHSVTLCDAQEPIPGGLASTPLVILDAQLKWAACRPLFEQCQSLGCPVLFWTGDHSMVAHLKALYAGPSDVVTLPFSAKTLLAKVTGLLGTQEGLRELTLDERERVALLDGQRVELTAQEFALLLVLMESPDTPISREQLLRKAWGYQSMGETRTVDVHVQRLRKKLGGERIETVYKCGYRLKMA